MNGNRGMKFLANAPECLKVMYEREGKAKKLLGMLLSDKKMAPIWTRLRRHIETDVQWMNLWQEIKTALYYASPRRKPKRVEDEIDDIRWIAARASELAAAIRIEGRKEKGYKRYYDFECHQFSPDQVMEINGILGWSSRTWQDKYEQASQLMKSWPTMSDLLEGLAAHALAEADAVGKERIVLKDKGCWSETMFARHLHDHMSQYSWETRDFRFATIATIATFASEVGLLKTKDNGGVAAKFVRNAVLGTDRPRKGGALSALKRSA